MMWRLNKAISDFLSVSKFKFKQHNFNQHNTPIYSCLFTSKSLFSQVDLNSYSQNMQNAEILLESICLRKKLLDGSFGIIRQSYQSILSFENIGSASCVFFKIALLRAIKKIWYKWGIAPMLLIATVVISIKTGRTQKFPIILQILSVPSGKYKGTKLTLGLDAVIVYILRLQK